MPQTRFEKKVEAKGLGRKCQCWDCVRQVGATPPRFQLKKHGLVYGKFRGNPYV